MPANGRWDLIRRVKVRRVSAGSWGSQISELAAFAVRIEDCVIKGCLGDRLSRLGGFPYLP